MVVEGSRRSRLALKMLGDTRRPQSSQDTQLSQDLESRLSKLEVGAMPDSGSDKNILTERVILTIFTLAEMLLKDPTFQDLALAFLVHTVLIGDLCISSRRQSSILMKDRDSDAHLIEFLSVFSAVSTRIMRHDSWRQALAGRDLPCDIVDLVDGRLFRRTVCQMTKASQEIKLSQLQVSNIDILRRALHSICGVQLQSDMHGSTFDGTMTAMENLDLQDGSRSISVLPFSNRVFDKHLASISISVNHSSIPDGQSARIFREVSHWHNAKRRLDSKIALPISDREKSRALRRNQFFMAEMQAYAASLTNAAGMLNIH